MKEHWSSVRLGEVLRQVGRAEAIDASRTYRLLGVRWYGQGLFVREEKLGAEIAANRVYSVKPGDFVYNRLFAWKGSFAVAGAETSGAYVSNEFPCFETDVTRLDPHFLLWFFRQKRSWTEVLGLSTGATPTSRNRLKEAVFLAMQIPLPLLAEQRRVVARIEEVAAQVHETRALRAGAACETDIFFRNAITRVIGENWPVVPLEAAVDPDRPITYGIVQAGEHVPDGIPYIRVSDMARPRLTVDGMLRTSPEIAARYQRSSVRSGDIVFAIRATIGKMRSVPNELDGANLTQGTARIAPSERATAPYLLWALQSCEVVEAIQRVVKGSTFREITLGRLRTIPVPLPPVATQKRITAELDALQAEVDSLKSLQAETAAELDALLPAVLDRAFKGELSL